MRLQTFVKQHRHFWNELEAMLPRMKKATIHRQQIERFETLYLSVSRQLSYAETNFPNEDVTIYLNDLVAKAHNIFYKYQLTSSGQIKDFFKTHFVRLLTDQWPFILISMIIFLIGAFAAFLSVLNDPLHAYSVLPGDLARQVDPNHVGPGSGGIDAAAMSLSIMTNNIQVAFLAFAGGLTLGVYTIYVLWTNGLMLGAMAALFMEHHHSYDFWAYIVPHGIIELTAIFIAGGSGLIMGYKFLVPGPRPRIYQLKTQAVRSVQLLIGTIPLFIIAGLIEGFVTPSSLPLFTKYLFALLTVAALVLYIIYGTRVASSDKTVNGLSKI